MKDVVLTTEAQSAAARSEAPTSPVTAEIPAPEHPSTPASSDTSQTEPASPHPATPASTPAPSDASPDALASASSHPATPAPSDISSDAPAPASPVTSQTEPASPHPSTSASPHPATPAPIPTPASKRWYKDLVFYQVWPRSFKDGDGDGMGDLWGVLEKLDYIKSLGCDGIWFSPIYPSPGADCGYDVADYCDVAPEFGGMEAFRAVLDGAHQRGMRVILDLVVNHTSDEHPWFQKSRRRIEPYTDYYIWRPAELDAEGRPTGKLPNNWDSNFEGSAWTFDEERGEYYLHLFAVKQPDLNMDNPLVRNEVKRIMEFWLDLGVDGFREDVITYISKPDGLPDDRLFPINKGMAHYNHGPRVHEYLAEFKRDVLDRYDCVTLAEAPLVTPKRALEYIDEQTGQMDMMIQFESQCADCIFTDWLPTRFSLRKLKRALTRWQKGLDGKAWNMLYLENHDHPRVVSRYGSEAYREASAKMLATAYLFLQGTPFIYQGQEIGMTNWRPTSPNLYEDVSTRWQYAHKHVRETPEKRLRRLWRSSRDSARTPMQWSGEDGAGFSTITAKAGKAGQLAKGDGPAKVVEGAKGEESAKAVEVAKAVEGAKAVEVAKGEEVAKAVEGAKGEEPAKVVSAPNEQPANEQPANEAFANGANHASLESIPEPWVPLNDNYREVNVADQERDPNSVLNFYRRAVDLRKSLPVVRYGTYREHFPLDNQQYVYTREWEGQKLLVACSFTDKPVPMLVPHGFDLKRARLMLDNYPALAETNKTAGQTLKNEAADPLRPYEARVYLIDKYTHVG